MERESMFIVMEVYMTDSGLRIRSKVMGYLGILMGISIVGCGVMI